MSASPLKRTCSASAAMSAKCQQRTSTEGLAVRVAHKLPYDLRALATAAESAAFQGGRAAASVVWRSAGGDEGGSVQMIGLTDYALLSIFLVSLIVVLTASEIGRWLGLRARDRGGDNVATLEAAVLGLLALMLGFTFAMALSRFEDRRDAILHEANAIGTTALRARLLPAPHNAEAIKLLRDYVQIRLDLTQRIPSPTELNAAIARSNAIQEGLWQRAQAVADEDDGASAHGTFHPIAQRDDRQPGRAFDGCA